jgi:hypothetical protein
MTNPPEDNHVAPGSCYSEGFLRRALEEATYESYTARRVRWSTAATEAYTQLYTLYEELRETGEAYAWSAAYEASALAGQLLEELRALLRRDGTIPPTQEPSQEPTPPVVRCGTTQHCAAWGWCHHCDTDAAAAARHMVKAVDIMRLPPGAAGETYAAAMHVLRRAARPLPPDQQRARCSLAQTGAPGHYPHPWEPQPGMTGVVCPGSGIDQHHDGDDQEGDLCPGK